MKKGDIFNPATKRVIPAAAELRDVVRQAHHPEQSRRGIQKKPCDYWIPAFAGMTGWWYQLLYLIARLIGSAVPPDVIEALQLKPKGGWSG